MIWMMVIDKYPVTASPPIGRDQNTLMVELPSLVVTVTSTGGLETEENTVNCLLLIDIF